MNRLQNVVLAGVSLCLAAVSAVAAAAAPAQQQQQRPNLVVIMTDDQAAWALGCYGNTECRTPHMDRIAREGVRFNNAFVVTPVCSPSRASFFTGRYGTELDITDWINRQEADAGVGIKENTLTWPKVLQQNGYVTALIGKWHLGHLPASHPTRHGFSHFFGFLGGGQQPMDPMLEQDGETKQFKGPIPDVMTDDALRFVEQNRDRPFALCLFFREPHQAYTPVPEEDSAPFVDLDPTVPQLPFLNQEWAKRRTREYYGSIHAADRNVGRLLDKLDELKLAENTIVIFTSDHGYNIGHHGIYTKGNGAWIAAGVHGPKRPNMFEESIRVPLMIKWPGVARPGSTVDHTVSNLDTFATVLGMLGIAMPEGLKQHGVDVSPLMRGQSIDRADELFAQYDLHNSGFACMRMIRTPEWKLVRHYLTNGLNELYDLKNDPGETKNLYNEAPARRVRNQLEKKLVAWQKSIDDPILTNPLNKPGVGGTVHAE